MARGVDQYGLDNSNWQQFVNKSGETIPAFACIRITGLGDDGMFILKADKPNAYGAQYSHFFNGGMDVADGDTGICNREFGCVGAYDPADGTPAVGELWGPRDNTWLLKKDTGGFVVQGVIDSVQHLVAVVPAPMLQVYGKASADIDQGDSGDFVIWVGDPGSEVTTGITMASIYNRWGDIANGAWVRADFDGKQFQYAISTC